MNTAMASGTVSITVTSGTMYSFSPVRLARLMSCTGCAKGSGLIDASKLPAAKPAVAVIPAAAAAGGTFGSSSSPGMGTAMLFVMVGLVGRGLGVVVVVVVVVLEVLLEELVLDDVLLLVELVLVLVLLLVELLLVLGELLVNVLLATP